MQCAAVLYFSEYISTSRRLSASMSGCTRKCMRLHGSKEVWVTFYTLPPHVYAEYCPRDFLPLGSSSCLCTFSPSFSLPDFVFRGHFVPVFGIVLSQGCPCAALLRLCVVSVLYEHVEKTQRHVRVYSQVHALARLESGVGNILHTPTTCLRRVLPSRLPPTCEAIILDE